MADGEPGVKCQIDFAQMGFMGFILDPESGRKQRVHALIFAAAYSRHMFVWLTYCQPWARCRRRSKTEQFRR
jgi:hypothetical protein